MHKSSVEDGMPLFGDDGVRSRHLSAGVQLSGCDITFVELGPGQIIRVSGQEIPRIPTTDMEVSVLSVSSFY